MAELIRMVSIITTFQLLLFAGFVLMLRKKGDLSHSLLLIFLVSNALFIAGFLIQHYLFVDLKLFVNFLFWGTTFGFLFGPLLYFYTKSVTIPGYKITSRFFLHLLPSLLYIVLVLLLFHLKPLEEKINLLQTGHVFPGNLGFWFNQVMNTQILIYLILSIVILKKHELSIKNSYSDIDTIKLSWLKLVIWAFVFMWFIDLVHYVLIRNYLITNLISNWLSLISLTINFVFAILIMYRGLKQPQYFDTLQTPIEKVKYENSALTKERSEEYLEELLAYMENEKPHLEPTLTLSNLAASLKVQPKVLSQIINQNLNQNFYDFVNDYRIREAKTILSDHSKSKMTVLEILYECGFNSKSVFNTAFKRNTGQTPTEYRLKNLTIQLQ
ncbi:MAG: helix-turn-helix transcriptional regulator [Ignavibacteriales bacterium]|nr:MAG: helix-turn-helix transcriptional regulator [Ignavibacteriales bacterium]